MKIIDKNFVIDNSINFLEGSVILINKPLDWTSFDVVNKIRYRLKNYHDIKKIKVGHNGTLDPRATGLLMIFTGKYTKRIHEEENHDKCYDALIKFGATTLSLDTETEECDFKDYQHVGEEMINIRSKDFLGEQLQEIPIFSATKVDGVAMYRLAREGKEFKTKSKQVIFHEIDLLSYKAPFLEMKVKCGKGTYIRAFARDLGSILNTSAYLYGLKRTEIASYLLSDAIELDDFCSKLESLEYTT